MSSKHENPADDRLIVIAEQSGQMMPANFSGELAVPIVERFIHLQNVISHIAQANQAGGFITIDDYHIAWDLPHASEPMRRGNEAKLEERTKAAKWEFLRATGNMLLVDAGIWNEDQKRQESLAMFEEFKTQVYASPEEYADAMKYKRALVAINEKIMLDVSKVNRKNEDLPHSPEATEKEGPYLAARARLTAVLEDPRAGFMPTTREELNDVIAYLDYLDNPEYPLVINNHFLEVFGKLQTLRRLERNRGLDSRRGALSITYEVEDYLNEALYANQALIGISEDILDLPNGRVTLGEESEWLNLEHPGYRALLRYRDLNDYRTEGLQTGRKDPLRTSTKSRWTREGPGRHKFVEDRYTEINPEKAFGKYVIDGINSMKVGEARNIILPAIEDQLRRANFATLVLKAIATPVKTDSRLLTYTLEPSASEAIRVLSEHQLDQAA